MAMGTMTSGSLAAQAGAATVSALSSIQDGFNYEIKRVQELAHRIEAVANSIVGFQPQAVSASQESDAKQPALSLEQQRRQLSESVDRCIDQLNRIQS